MLTNNYHKTDFKQYLQTIIRETLPHNACKVLSENSFQTMPTNYCKINNFKHIAYELFSEKRFQGMSLFIDTISKILEISLVNDMMKILYNDFNKILDNATIYLL